MEFFYRISKIGLDFAPLTSAFFVACLFNYYFIIVILKKNGDSPFQNDFVSICLTYVLLSYLRHRNYSFNEKERGVVFWRSLNIF